MGEKRRFPSFAETSLYDPVSPEADVRDDQQPSSSVQSGDLRQDAG
jgi:hypothetical protein